MKRWTAPTVIPLTTAADAQQRFSFCGDGMNGRGRRINNCGGS